MSSRGHCKPGEQRLATGVHCSYCGKQVAKCDREHVFPTGLYPASKSTSRVQRLTVPACRSCNSSFADDEAHFRNTLMLAGEPNEVRRELWDEKVLRSFDKVDGPRRVKDLLARMIVVKASGSEARKIFPGKDERVVRVVRKIIRGLCHHHDVLSPVSDERVWACVPPCPVPPAFLGQMCCHHREQDIVEYRYQVLNEEAVNSVWLITFFERVTFMGMVSTSHSGFA